MLPSLLLATALTAPAASGPPGVASSPTGLPPQPLYLQADAAGQVFVSGMVTQTRTVNRVVNVIENGKPVQKVEPAEVLQNISIRTPLADVAGKFATAGGTELSAETAARRVKDGGVVLISADGKPVDAGWLRGVDPETIVVTADTLKNLRPYHGGTFQASTPAPRVAMLAADEDGKVRVEVNPNFAVQNAGFEGRVVRPQLVGPGTATVLPKKALEEVTFEAYDLTGKVVAREDALKRLASGGLVVVAGDSRLPDEAYLKAFKGDVLVLASSELVLPLNIQKAQRLAAIQAVAAPAGVLPALPVIPAPNAKPLVLKPAVRIEVKQEEKK